eukprot:1160004-Pelagomonas_calceolata.AAC.3
MPASTSMQTKTCKGEAYRLVDATARLCNDDTLQLLGACLSLGLNDSETLRMGSNSRVLWVETW